MTIEQWRAAITRWGDPVLALALLLTDDEAAAETATIAAFTHALAAPAPRDQEQALYAAVWARRPRPRTRVLRRLRRHSLPRSLNRLAADARGLAGLWLLRSVSGPTLVEISGLPAPAIVDHLVRVLAQHGTFEPDTTDDAAHLTLRRWLYQQLRLPGDEPPVGAEHIRLCPVCHERIAAWQAAADALRASLRDAVRQHHLSVPAAEQIEDQLLAQRDGTAVAWWRRRNLVVPVLAAIGVMLLLIIWPRQPRGTEDPAPAAPATVQDARGLVQAAFDGWTRPPASGTIHQRVWATSPWLHGGDEVLTDVWLAGGTSREHRVEVRRNGRLVEWQVATGTARGRFAYAAEPIESSCRWNTGWRGNADAFDARPLEWTLAPEAQQRVRDERLKQGAYGVGYVALQHALAASDLRSLGTVAAADTPQLVLQYTDEQAEPVRQVLLRISLDTRQLQLVQEITLVGNQAQTRDRWRLESITDTPQGVPTRLPDGPTPHRPRELLDPACPPLQPEFVVSPRMLLGTDRPWFAPRALPASIGGALLLSDNPVGLRSRSGLRAAADSTSLLLSGPGRWLVVSTMQTTLDDAATRGTPRGRWTVELDTPDVDGTWHATLRLAADRDVSYGPLVELWAVGWTGDELLDLAETLVPLNGTTWLELADGLLDVQPLDPAVQGIVVSSLRALDERAERSFKLVSETTVRTRSTVDELPDPYHVPLAVRFPPILERTQWLEYDDGLVMRFYDLRRTPDGAVYELLQDDGAQFTWYTGYEEISYTGAAAILRRFSRPEPADATLLFGMLANPEPIELGRDARGLLLEQHSDTTASLDDASTFGPGLSQRIRYRDLGPGTIVRRLWLDEATMLPRGAAVLHRDGTGAETPIIMTAIRERRAADLPPDLFDRSVLAPDTLTWDVDNGEPTLTNTIELPARILGWPPTATRLQVTSMPTRRQAAPSVMSSLRAPWNLVIGIPGTAVATYRMLPEDAEVRLVQGPRALLRNVLRNQAVPADNPRGTAWRNSRSLLVMIDGREREAWLLEDGLDTVLIVEVDDLLLHFTGPAEYLSGPLLDQLPELEWQTTSP